MIDHAQRGQPPVVSLERLIERKAFILGQTIHAFGALLDDA
jgi:hypothetical protein